MNTEPLTTWWDVVYAVAFGFVCGVLALFALVGLLRLLLLVLGSTIEAFGDWRERVRSRRFRAKLDRDRAAKSEPNPAPR